MRKYGRHDDNRDEIIAALEQIGSDVIKLDSIGRGCPDLLCGRRGVNLLLEVKDGSKPLSQRRLTPAELKFYQTWRGHKAVVNNIQEAVSEVLRNS